MSWRIWLVTILPYVLGAGAGWLIVPILTENGADGGRMGFAIAGFYGAVSAYLVNCLIAPRLQKPLVAEEGVFCGSMNLNWNENDITISIGGATYTVSWSALSGTTETNHTLFLQVERYEAFVIPLSVFKDEDDLAAFKHFADERIAAT
ncbi:MAG: YcxB family protein [Pseudomonadota bacterium]